LARTLTGALQRVQFCSRQNCLCTSKDKFDGIEFERPQAGPKGNVQGGTLQKESACGAAPRS